MSKNFKIIGDVNNYGEVKNVRTRRKAMKIAKKWENQFSTVHILKDDNLIYRYKAEDVDGGLRCTRWYAFE